MPRIFISYRRDDSITAAGRIYDNLVLIYDEESVFLDTEDIPPGVEWDTYLTNNITSCDVVLVVIGDKWLDVADNEGNRRLDLPNDFVRFEVEVALRQEDVTVIPVLIKNATMPSAGDLPESLDQLPRRNAIRVRDGADFRPDMARLVGSIQTQPKRPWLPFAISLIASLLVIALIMALIFIFLPGNKTQDILGDATIKTYHGTELESSETMQIQVDIILTTAFITDTPRSLVSAVTVNADLSNENAGSVQNPTPTSTPSSTKELLNIPRYIIIELSCPGNHIMGCRREFRKIEVVGVNSLQWTIYTSGDFSGTQGLQLKMYTANADGTVLSQSAVWTYAFDVNIINSGDGQAVAQNITATAAQTTLDAQSTIFAQQTRATTPALVNTQSNPATAPATEIASAQGLEETATALANGATNQAQIVGTALQAVISMTETAEAVQQSTTNAIINATQLVLDAQTADIQGTTVPATVTLDPFAATATQLILGATQTALANGVTETQNQFNAQSADETATNIVAVITSIPDNPVEEDTQADTSSMQSTYLSLGLVVLVLVIMGGAYVMITSHMIRVRNYNSED